MQLFCVDTGLFKLDGGAMFGVVPQSIWKKLNPPDANNLCTWAMRCLLIQDGNRLILIDNGIGEKQDEKFLGHYFLHGNDTLDSSLKKIGFHRDDITDVILTHLHFDHCGGSIQWNSKRDGYEPAFKNARFWSNEAHWEWATVPNAREKASFLKENILPIKESGQLMLLNGEKKFSENVDLIYCSGHTESMMLPVIHYKGRKIVFCADLIPSVHHLPLPYVMAYDTRPLLSLEEKGQLLKQFVEEDCILFFEHDPLNECCTLEATEKGVRAKDLIRLAEL